MDDQSTSVTQKPSEDASDADQSWRYWEAAKSPLASAVFVLPLLVLYEFCVFRLPAEEITNGAHQWVNKLLMQVGLHDLLIPLCMLLILFLWQYFSRQAVEISHKTLIGMWSESILFAMLLIGLGQAQQLAMIGRSNLGVEQINQSWQPVYLQVQGTNNVSQEALLTANDYQRESLAVDREIREVISNTQPEAAPKHHDVKHEANLEHPRQRLISYLGAGIYEETIFRLLLIPVLYFALKPVFISTSISMFLALVMSSLMFALAHEVIPIANVAFAEIPAIVSSSLASDAYRQFVFAFRTLAGLYFGILFYYRGFGIAVGAHFVYDIFVGIMLR